MNIAPMFNYSSYINKSSWSIDHWVQLIRVFDVTASPPFPNPPFSILETFSCKTFDKFHVCSQAKKIEKTETRNSFIRRNDSKCPWQARASQRRRRRGVVSPWHQSRSNIINLPCITTPKKSNLIKSHSQLMTKFFVLFKSPDWIA